MRVAVSNLAGATAASDIAVQLVWSNGRTTDLLVLSVTRRDKTKQVYAVQDWFADVTTLVHPQPSNLKPQTSNLNTQPSTLKPQTSNPQPSTSNPQPSTLTPQP